MFITTLQPGLRPRFTRQLYGVCKFLIHEWQVIQFKIDFKRQIFEILLMAIYLLSEFFTKNLVVQGTVFFFKFRFWWRCLP